MNPSEAEVKKAFKKKGEPPYFLIVCAKLLTGFDAPVESVMYLDNPLKEHNLLQAIARTNRVEGDKKQFGLIVDYIGITKHLNKALSTYRKEDIQGALHSLDERKTMLKVAHREVMQYIMFPIHVKKADKVGDEFKQLIQALGAIDMWYQFKIKAKAFLKAYEALCPDPEILLYTEDMKWIVLFIEYGALFFEKKESFSIRNYSAKIRELLNTHLSVSGLKTLIQLKHITDPDFFEDFKPEGKDKEEIRDTVLRKVSELKKVIRERVSDNPQEYEPFSKRILALIRKLESGLVDATDLLKEAEKLAKDVIDEDNAHKKTGLTRNGYGIWKILEAFKPTSEKGEGEAIEVKDPKPKYNDIELLRLQKIAIEIENIYVSDETAPVGWHLKEQLRKELRMQVRHIALQAELDWRLVPVEVEKYALKHFIKAC